MIAPVAFQDKLYPEQRLLDSWNEELALKWLDRWNTYFHPDNGVSYGSPVSIGTDFGSSIAKYQGGTLTPTGDIFVLGHLADNYAQLNSFTDSISTVSQPTNPSSRNAIYHPFTNCVYFAKSGGITKLDLDTSSVTQITTVSGQNYIFPVYSGRRIYLHGTTTTRTMHYLDVLTDTVTSTGVSWSGDRTGGSLTWNNKTYMVGGGGVTNVQVYDFNNDTTSTITGGSSFSAGAFRFSIMHPDGYVYLFGAFSNDVIKRIDPRTDTMVDIGTMPSTDYKFFYAALGADGKIYMCGETTTIGVYEPKTNTFSTITAPDESYQGIVMGALGDLYFVPWTANRFLKLPAQNANKLYSVIQEYNGITFRHRWA